MSQGVAITSINDPLVAQATLRLVRARTDLADNRPPHTCSARRCNPKTEEDLIRDGHLEGPPLTTNVYLCALGATHVCSAQTCTLYLYTPTQTCPVSSIVHGSVSTSYAKDDPRTWYGKSDASAASSAGASSRKRMRASAPAAVAATPNKRTHLDVADTALRMRAGAMITQLLFGKNRISRNNVEIQRNRAAADEACAAYTQHMRSQRQLPYWTDVYRLRGEWMQRELPLREFEFDEARFNYYVDVVHHVWRLVVRYYGSATEGSPYQPLNHVSVESITVGVLYSMKTGKRHQGHVLLPCDPFLAENLPSIGDLEQHFGVQRNQVTRGENAINVVYERGIAQNSGSTQTLMLDAASLAPARVDAKASARLAQVKETSNVPVRMASNGSILFMPQSRTKRRV